MIVIYENGNSKYYMDFNSLQVVDDCNAYMHAYRTKMSNFPDDESETPMFYKIANKFFLAITIKHDDIRHYVNFPTLSRFRFTLTQEDKIFTTDTNYTGKPQLHILKQGYTIEMSSKGKLTVMWNDITNNCDSLDKNEKPTDNKGIVYFYDLLNTCKDSDEVKQSTLTMFDLPDLEQVEYYLAEV